MHCLVHIPLIVEPPRPDQRTNRPSDHRRMQTPYPELPEMPQDQRRRQRPGLSIDGQGLPGLPDGKVRCVRLENREDRLIAIHTVHG